MPKPISRRPPNLRINLFTGALIGLIIASLFLYCWWIFALAPVQQHLFGMYAKSEIMVMLPHSKRTPNPWPLRHEFLSKVFDGQPVQDILLMPASVAVGLVFTSMLFAILLYKRNLQQLREGKKVRGPRKVKGDGYAFPISPTKK